MTNTTMASSDTGPMAQLQTRAQALRLTGLLAHWDELVSDPARLSWAAELMGWEETERDQRSLERRLRSAHIGKFKPLADFEWDWPRRCDRQAIDELMTLSFMADASNVMLVGPNGVGKSMLACNLGHRALTQGHTVLFITAGQLLGDLAALDSDSALRRRLRHYAAPDLLLVDEVGYLSYSNRAFKEWHEVFPNAACVVSLIDRLVHRCDIVAIEGESYRLKEAKARSELKAAARAAAPAKGKKA